MTTGTKATLLACYLGAALFWTMVDWKEFFQRPTLNDFARILLAMAFWPVSMLQEFWWRPRQRRKRQDKDCG